jgi:biopolymer transport protein ExbD
MPLKTQQDEPPQLNLTPMIDVLFLLIMFFMVASSFNDAERNVKVQVPQVAEAGDGVTPPQPRVVNVFADGRIDLDGHVVTEAELTAKLAEFRSSSSDPTVIVRGDANCPFQHIAAALSACRAAKISDLGITVRIADAGPQATVR